MSRRDSLQNKYIESIKIKDMKFNGNEIVGIFKRV